MCRSISPYCAASACGGRSCVCSKNAMQIFYWHFTLFYWVSNCRRSPPIHAHPIPIYTSDSRTAGDARTQTHFMIDNWSCVRIIYLKAVRIYDSWKFLSANGACLAFKSIDDGSDDDDDNGLMAYIFSSRQICVTQTIEVKKKM